MKKTETTDTGRALRLWTRGTAISLATFSGAVATWGLTKLVPGGELVVGAMGALFEAGKLTAFSNLHRPIPRPLRWALGAAGGVLMLANVAGVSGFLSGAYEHQVIGQQATATVTTAVVDSQVALIERQLKAAEKELSAAQEMQLKARANKGRAEAAQKIVVKATVERDALIAKLGEAKVAAAKVEGTKVQAGTEFAAVAFIAAATGTSPETVTHVAILVLATAPDMLALLLLLAAGHKPATTQPVAQPAPVRKPKLTPRQLAARKGVETRRRRKREAAVAAAGTKVARLA
jgi:hypothetical protein